MARSHAQKYLALPHNLPPRGLCREAAAAYMGVGNTKFDEMVIDGRMPKPRQIDSRSVWDVRELDRAFDLLPNGDAEQVNPWKAVM